MVCVDPSAYASSAAKGKPPGGQRVGSTVVFASRAARRLAPIVSDIEAIDASGSSGSVGIVGTDSTRSSL